MSDEPPTPRPHEPDASTPPAPVLEYRSAGSALPDTSDRAVVVATFGDAFEANLARLKLEDAGIRCFTEGESLMSGVGTYVGAMRRVDLSVAAKDVEDACRVLDSIKAARAARLEGPVAPPCPKCGAPGAIKRLGRGSMAVILVALAVFTSVLLQSPLWFGPSLPIAAYLILTWEKQRWTCVRCGTKFTGKAVEPVDEADEDSDPV